MCFTIQMCKEVLKVSIGGINGYRAYGASMTGMQGYGEDTNPMARLGPKRTDGKGVGPEHQIKPGRRSSPAECKTCKNRKYKDGSDEMVSFKAPGHIDPNNAASVVLSHEHEHVSNAYLEAHVKHGRVQMATVKLKTAICPECGRSYISGGETNTQIKYYNEDNPYQKGLKKTDAVKLRGAHLDIAA